MGLFKTAFYTGDWTLWNGNNWTPHLAAGAMAWAISFWHEEQPLAAEVIRMCNDLYFLFLFLGVLFVRTWGGFSPRVAHESRELN